MLVYMYHTDDHHGLVIEFNIAMLGLVDAVSPHFAGILIVDVLMTLTMSTCLNPANSYTGLDFLAVVSYVLDCQKLQHGIAHAHRRDRVMPTQRTR